MQVCVELAALRAAVSALEEDHRLSTWPATGREPSPKVIKSLEARRDELRMRQGLPHDDLDLMSTAHSSHCTCEHCTCEPPMPLRT